VACTKFSVNRPKQTKVIEQNPKVDACPPAADFTIKKECRSILLYMLLQQTVVKPAPVTGEVAAATVTLVQQSVGHGVVFHHLCVLKI